MQLDGILVRQSGGLRRVTDLSWGAALSFVYAQIVEGMNDEKRIEFDYELQDDETVAIEYEGLPAGLQGERPPSWWVTGR